MPPTDKPQWDGTPLADGALLLVADQGFGDVIQFSRYIPWVLQRCPDIAIACTAEMIPVLRQFAAGRQDIVPGGRTVRHTRRSARCPACRGCTARGWITCRPRSPICAPIRPASQLGRSGCDGLAPQSPSGSASSGRGGRRTTTTATARPCWRISRRWPRCRASRWSRLQKGPTADQAGELFRPRAADQHRRRDSGLRRYDGDPGVPRSGRDGRYLGRASGRRRWAGRCGSCWPRAPDWRWLLEREDTPWYPTVRLFRQTVPQQWSDVFQRVSAALQEVRKAKQAPAE